MMLSEHFSLDEFTRSATAARYGIRNIPGDTTIKNLQILCLQVLEPARKTLGGTPLVVTSGYRCRVLNDKIGGVPNSYHTKGMAADLAAPDRKTQIKIGEALINQPLTDLVLLETSKHTLWVHVQWSHRPRRLINYDYHAV